MIDRRHGTLAARAPAARPARTARQAARRRLAFRITESKSQNYG